MSNNVIVRRVTIDLSLKIDDTQVNNLKAISELTQKELDESSHPEIQIRIKKVDCIDLMIKQLKSLRDLM